MREKSAGMGELQVLGEDYGDGCLAHARQPHQKVGRESIEEKTYTTMRMDEMY